MVAKRGKACLGLRNNLISNRQLGNEGCVSTFTDKT